MASQISRKTGIEAVAYHAGLSDSARAKAQSDWMEGRVKIAVATVAFGMGIDRACVRYVVHWHMSKTVEGFYQVSMIYLAENRECGWLGKVGRNIL